MFPFFYFQRDSGMLAIGDTGLSLVSLNGDIYPFENKQLYFYPFLVLQNSDNFPDQTVKKADLYGFFLSKLLNNMVS